LAAFSCQVTDRTSVHSRPVRITKWRVAYVRELVLVALSSWRTSQPAGLCLGYSDVGGGFIQCILPNPEMTAFSILTNNDSAECLMVFVRRNWEVCKTPLRINYRKTVKWPSCFKNIYVFLSLPPMEINLAILMMRQAFSNLEDEFQHIMHRNSRLTKIRSKQFYLFIFIYFVFRASRYNLSWLDWNPI
jgi:hypothetical protein